MEPTTLVSVFVGSSGLCWLLARRPEPLARRTLRYAGLAPAQAAAKARAAAPARPAYGGWLAGLERPLEVLHAQAGSDASPGRRLGTLGLAAALGAAAGAALGWPGVGLTLGGLASLGVLVRRRTLRRMKLAGQLPDAMLMLASGLRAGLGFQQALQHGIQDGAEPLRGELLRLERDLALGLAPETAFTRLETRLGTTDGEMFCAALLLQRQTGSNLAETLVNLDHTMRDRQAIHDHVRTLTAQGRLSGTILCALPLVVGLALYGLNPTYLAPLLDDPRGRVLALAASGLMLFAIVCVRRIIRIQL